MTTPQPTPGEPPYLIAARQPVFPCELYYPGDKNTEPFWSPTLHEETWREGMPGFTHWRPLHSSSPVQEGADQEPALLVHTFKKMDDAGLLPPNPLAHPEAGGTECKQCGGVKPWCELEDRITNYFGNGGLFNPEIMEHNKVSQLLMDVLDAIRMSGIARHAPAAQPAKMGGGELKDGKGGWKKTALKYRDEANAGAVLLRDTKAIARQIMQRTEVATFATQREIVKDLASQIVLLEDSARPSGEPGDTGGEPTDSQMLDWAEAKNAMPELTDNGFWMVRYAGQWFTGNDARQAIKQAMRATQQGAGEGKT